MELVNSTTVVASTMVAESIDPERRSVLGIAKATFVVSTSGAVKLDRVDPMPIYTKDVETRYGVLPREDIPRLDPVFEVMVLGNAYAPDDTPVAQRQIDLQVGHIQQSLLVHGNRHWVGDSDNASISHAEAFTRMPLGWHLAYGGTEEVEIDDESFVDVADPVNPVGKGFNYRLQIEQLASALRCPDGYPRFSAIRQLPNIESAKDPISQPGQVPLPVCWAPCMNSSGIIIERMKRAQRAAGQSPELQADAVKLGSPLMLHRAHPDWVIETPAAESIVRLEGMTPKQALEFKLPTLRVLMDVSVGAEERTVELHPNGLTLFPDLRKFTIIFRGVIPYRYRASDQRTARIRLENGWAPAPLTAAQKRRLS
ncbi:MAG: DUF2169 domain-containing protein [Granulosicoccus sp.]